MLEFHSAPSVVKQVESKYRSIFALIESVLWGALPDKATQCVFIGRSCAGWHEYETRFHDSSGEAYINWVQETVSERVMKLMTELRSLLPAEDEAEHVRRFRASLSEQGTVRTEFLCIPDMVEPDVEIFMYRTWRGRGFQVPSAKRVVL